MPKSSYIYKIKKKHRYQKYVGIIFSVFIFYLGTSGVIWLFLKSPVFKFKAINFENNQKISDEKIMDFFYSQVFRGNRLNYLLGFQNFLIWPSIFEEDDLKLLPGVKSITIKKDYVKKELTAVISEREPYGIWCHIKSSEEELVGQENCWMFDREGKIFARTAAAEGGRILVVDDYSEREIGLYSKIAPDIFISNIFSVLELIKRLELKIKKIEITDWNLREIKVSLLGGPIIYFSLARPIKSEEQAIRFFMEKPDFYRFEYLDFRVENRLYYR